MAFESGEAVSTELYSVEVFEGLLYVTATQPDVSAQSEIACARPPVLVLMIVIMTPLKAMPHSTANSLSFPT